MSVLSDEEIEAALADLPGWSRQDDAIVKQFEFPSFGDAIAFINRIADIAEAADHHPEMTNVYNRVRVVYSTHSEGGITQKDVDAARQVEADAG